MTGRGNGCEYGHINDGCFKLIMSAVPDLVFNEMNFLQRPTEHRDEPANDDTQRHASKTGRKREPDEDISAYFTKSKGPLVEGSEPANKRQKKSQTIEKDETGQKVKQQTRARQKTPPIELPQKPFLGFGRKGVQPENNRTRKESPGYFSWPESVAAREPAQTPLEQPDGHQLSRRRSHHGDMVSNRAPNATSRSRTKRGGGPVPLKIDKPAVAQSSRDRKQDTSRTRTTLQSLPRLGDRHEADRTSKSERVPSGYRTSEILDILEPRQVAIDRTMAYRHILERGERTGSDKENNDPNSSIDKLLNQAQEALGKRSSPAYRHREASRCGQDDFIQDGNLQSRQIESAETSTAHRMAPNQLHGQNNVATNHYAAEVPRDISVGHHRFGSNLRVRSEMRGNARHGWDGNGGVHGVQERLLVHPDDEEMLDNGTAVEFFRFDDNQTYRTGHQPEDFVFQSESVAAPSIINTEAERVELKSQNWPLMSGRMVSITPSTHAMSIGREFTSERLAGLHQEVSDDLAGFWKPNKLY